MIYKAEYLIPGLLFPDETTRELTAHDPQEALELAPEHAYCFYLYDLRELPPGIPTTMLEEFTVRPKPQNREGRFYIGGDIFDADDLELLGGDYSILLANMRGNGWERVIRCRTGNWQPFEEGDTLLSPLTTGDR